jgi:hypothetical protein
MALRDSPRSRIYRLLLSNKGTSSAELALAESGGSGTFECNPHMRVMAHTNSAESSSFWECAPSAGKLNRISRLETARTVRDAWKCVAPGKANGEGKNKIKKGYTSNCSDSANSRHPILGTAPPLSARESAKGEIESMVRMALLISAPFHFPYLR